jgi:hypothetical protein
MSYKIIYLFFKLFDVLKKILFCENVFSEHVLQIQEEIQFQCLRN